MYTGPPPYTPQTCNRQTGAYIQARVFLERKPSEHSIVKVCPTKSERKTPHSHFRTSTKGGKGEGRALRAQCYGERCYVLCLLMRPYEQTQPLALFSRVAESWSNFKNASSSSLPLGAPTPRSLRQTRRDGEPPDVKKVERKKPHLVAQCWLHSGRISPGDRQSRNSVDSLRTQTYIHTYHFPGMYVSPDTHTFDIHTYL